MRVSFMGYFTVYHIAITESILQFSYGGNEAGVDHVLIQPFLLYYVNHVVLMLSSIFKAKSALEKGRSLYQNKVNLSLAFTQRLGH